jgi:hypothetical protein
MGEDYMIKRGLNHRLAEVGKIKIGGKGETRTKSNGKGTYQLPVRYDHFVVTTTAKGKDGNFIPDEKVMKALGDRPTELKIRLLFDDIDMNFFTSFAFYHGAKCLCRGDGEIAEMEFIKAGKPSFRLLDRTPNGDWTDSAEQKVQAGEVRHIECDPDTCPNMRPDANGATRCKPSGILSCILPDANEIGGVYRFRTHSWNTLSNILASLDLIKTISGGVLVGLPLKLQMLKKSTEEHGNVNTVNIAFDGEDYQQMRKQALLEMKNRTEHGINMLQIEHQAKAAGFMTDTDDPADVEAEFYVTEPDGPAPEQADDIGDRAGAILGDVEPLPEPSESDDGQPEEDEPKKSPLVIGIPPKDDDGAPEPEPDDSDEYDSDDGGQLDIF